LNQVNNVWIILISYDRFVFIYFLKLKLTIFFIIIWWIH